jgi:hypothetical protein
MSDKTSCIRTASWLFTILTVSVCASAAHAGTMLDFDREYWYENLAKRSVYDAVGRMDVTFASGGSTWGSGVLIAPGWVLTAGHVVTGMSNMTYVDTDGRKHAVKKWYAHRGWDGKFFTGHDIALVKLSSPIRNIKPARLQTSGSALNKEVTIVGYGTTGTGLTGNFIADKTTKRAGNNIVDGYFKGGDRPILTYDFDGDPFRYGFPVESADDYPLTLEYMAAGGDSGGGVFNGDSLVGITVFGTIGSFFRDIFPGYKGRAGVTSVVHHAGWIKWVISRANRGLAVGNYAAVGSKNSPLDELLADDASLAAEYELFLGGFTPVPEPATVTLLLMGTAALLRRPRRHAA